MSKRCGVSRNNNFRVRDETTFRDGGRSLPGMVSMDDDDGGFDFYADDYDDGPHSRYDEGRGTRSDFGLYDELAPYLADNEVVAMIEVGLDVELNDVYHLVHGTWGGRPSRVGY